MSLLYPSFVSLRQPLLYVYYMVKTGRMQPIPTVDQCRKCEVTVPVTCTAEKIENKILATNRKDTIITTQSAGSGHIVDFYQVEEERQNEKVAIVVDQEPSSPDASRSTILENSLKIPKEILKNNTIKLSELKKLLLSQNINLIDSDNASQSLSQSRSHSDYDNIANFEEKEEDEHEETNSRYSYHDFQLPSSNKSNISTDFTGVGIPNSLTQTTQNTKSCNSSSFHQNLMPDMHSATKLEQHIKNSRSNSRNISRQNSVSDLARSINFDTKDTRDKRDSIEEIVSPTESGIFSGIIKTRHSDHNHQQKDVKNIKGPNQVKIEIENNVSSKISNSKFNFNYEPFILEYKNIPTFYQINKEETFAIPNDMVITDQSKSDIVIQKPNIKIKMNQHYEFHNNVQNVINNSENTMEILENLEMTDSNSEMSDSNLDDLSFAHDDSIPFAEKVARVSAKYNSNYSGDSENSSKRNLSKSTHDMSLGKSAGNHLSLQNLLSVEFLEISSENSDNNRPSNDDISTDMNVEKINLSEPNLLTTNHPQFSNTNSNLTNQFTETIDLQNNKNLKINHQRQTSFNSDGMMLSPESTFGKSHEFNKKKTKAENYLPNVQKMMTEIFQVEPEKLDLSRELLGVERHVL